jgi:TonB family protein
MIACDRQAVSDTEEVTMKSVVVTGYSTFPAEVQKAIDAIKAKNPDAELQVIGVSGDTLDSKTIKFDNIQSMSVIKDIPNSKFKSYIILEKGSTTDYHINDDKVYTTTEQQAEYPGGYNALANFLGSNMKYPTVAKEKGITGKVFVKFVIGEDGSISDVAITKSLSPECDAEALRVVKLMPKWTAAKDKGVNVKSIFTLPIVFKLQ